MCIEYLARIFRNRLHYSLHHEWSSIRSKVDSSRLLNWWLTRRKNEIEIHVAFYYFFNSLPLNLAYVHRTAALEQPNIKTQSLCANSPRQNLSNEMMFWIRFCDFCVATRERKTVEPAAMLLSPANSHKITIDYCSNENFASSTLNTSGAKRRFMLLIHRTLAVALKHQVGIVEGSFCHSMFCYVFPTLREHFFECDQAECWVNEPSKLDAEHLFAIFEYEIF